MIVKRAFNDAVSVLKALIAEPVTLHYFGSIEKPLTSVYKQTVVVGGGAIESAISHFLRMESRSSLDSSHVAFQAFADVSNHHANVP